MSVLMGEEVLDALRVWERRARRTARRLLSFCCMAVFMSFLFGEMRLAVFGLVNWGKIGESWMVLGESLPDLEEHRRSCACAGCIAAAAEPGSSNHWSYIHHCFFFYFLHDY